MIKHRGGGFSRCLALCLLLTGCAHLGVDGEPAAEVPVRSEAEAAYAADDWARASRAYRGYLDAKPDDAEAWYRLGNAEARRGELAAAEAAYRQSLALAPERARARHNLGLVQLQLGRRNLLEARRELPVQDPAAAATMRYLACLMETFRGRSDSPVCDPDDAMEAVR